MPDFLNVKDWDEDMKDELAEEMGPLVKKHLAASIGADAFNYFMFEVLEVEKEGEQLRCKCDVEHKGQFEATQKHFVRSFSYTVKDKVVGDI